MIVLVRVTANIKIGKVIATSAVLDSTLFIFVRLNINIIQATAPTEPNNKPKIYESKNNWINKIISNVFVIVAIITNNETLIFVYNSFLCHT